MQTFYTLIMIIQVRLTGLAVCVPDMSYVIENINTLEYVSAVLPNEWYRDWPEESLKAGAFAVGNFAQAEMISSGFVWDCNWDQVHDKSKRTPETDKAAREVLGWVLVKDGEIVKTYYDDYDSTCHIREQPENCMGQWETKTDAENGMSWQEIILKYYDGELVWLPKIRVHRKR